MIIFKKILFTLFFIGHCAIAAHEKAVICVPVADLLGQPISTTHPDQPITDAYQTLPVCHHTNPQYSCPRLHQLLYNDIVDIVSIKNDEIQIQISQLFYTTQSSQEKKATYWTAAKNLCTFTDLENNNINNNHIPEPISFNRDQQSPSQQIITLTQPHYDARLNITFSAGTRFVRTQKTAKQANIKVFAIDHNTHKELCIAIPTHKCFIESTTTPQKQIEQYVFVLKSWAHQNNSFIPYVWGGTSFVTTYNQPFSCITKNSNGNEASFFEFDNDTASPKGGFDCSGLISRAAHICGMPYFYKNTTTIGQHLQSLEPHDTLINGDLILIKGHVMVVSNIDNNMLIEARAYGHGYGKVHEIELHKVFDEIDTYDNLCKWFFEKKPLKRKDIHGNIRDTFTDWKLLRIMSIYK